MNPIVLLLSGEEKLHYLSREINREVEGSNLDLGYTSHQGLLSLPSYRGR